MGVSATYFERLVAALSRYGPVHSLDLPDFGGVPHPQTSRTIAQYADLVEQSITVLGLTDPVLVGHSMGAQVVPDLAARHPT
jgi:pimeloyl-ACP methyl ester carboxylesterase